MHNDEDFDDEDETASSAASGSSRAHMTVSSAGKPAVQTAVHSLPADAELAAKLGRQGQRMGETHIAAPLKAVQEQNEKSSPDRRLKPWKPPAVQRPVHSPPDGSELAAKLGRRRKRMGETISDDNIAASLKAVQDQSEKEMKTGQEKVKEPVASSLKAAENLRKDSEAAAVQAARTAAAFLEHQTQAQAELVKATKNRQEQEAAAQDADAADQRKEDDATSAAGLEKLKEAKASEEAAQEKFKAAEEKFKCASAEADKLQKQADLLRNDNHDLRGQLQEQLQKYLKLLQENDKESEENEKLRVELNTR